MASSQVPPDRVAPDHVVSDHVVYLADVEAAINWWLAREAAADGVSLPADVRPLVDLYARMIHAGADRWPERDVAPAAMLAWLAWYASTPDAPCIAICSTSQGDGVCKGCGRTFDEVQHWIAMTPVAKREVWRRITAEGTAWRFRHYADRAALVAGDAAGFQERGVARFGSGS